MPIDQSTINLQAVMLVRLANAEYEAHAQQSPPSFDSGLCLKWLSDRKVYTVCSAPDLRQTDQRHDRACLHQKMLASRPFRKPVGFPEVTSKISENDKNFIRSKALSYTCCTLQSLSLFCKEYASRHLDCRNKRIDDYHVHPERQAMLHTLPPKCVSRNCLR